MHRIRITTAALVSTVALTVAGAPALAHADAPDKEPCAKQQAQVDKAEDALARVTAVFAKQQAKTKQAKSAVAHADNRSEKAAAKAELRQARMATEHAAKAKKAQQMRLTKATERLETCQAGGDTTA